MDSSAPLKKKQKLCVEIDDLSLHPQIIHKLKIAKLCSFKAILHLSQQEIQKTANVSSSESKNILEAASKASVENQIFSEDDLDEVFHPELPVHVNKQADLPAYLKQLDLERIGYIPIDVVQVYTDDGRDDYYRSGSRIYIKLQDHILRIQRRNLDGCSVFRSERIAIDEALGSLASLPNGKEIWILSDSRSAIQHLSNWQSVRDNVGVSILTELKRLSTSHQIHLQWIPPHIDLEGNEIADTLTKAGACEVPEASAPLTFL
ncbi:uncharacterized protein TNCV_942491 [Trichonephila clavipes]|nr:uncharacterized protein TNCV_942491 [Trichonephila clavipes]